METEIGEEVAHLLLTAQQNFKDCLVRSEFEVAKQIHTRLVSIGKLLCGSPLYCDTVLLLLLVQRSIFQIQLFLFNQGLLVTTEVSQAMAVFKSIISKICRLFEISVSHDAVQEGLRQSLAYFKQKNQHGICSVLLSMSLLAVILDSLTNSVSGDDTCKCVLATLCAHAAVQVSADSLTSFCDFDVAVEVKSTLEGIGCDIEQIYLKAWHMFQAGEYKAALDCMKNVEMSSATTSQRSLVKLLQGNCYLHLDCPNLAMLSYRDSMTTANNIMLMLVLYNCSCLSRKYANFNELDFRNELLKNMETLPEHGQLLVREGRGFSLFHLPSAINYYDVSLYTGLRAIQLNNPQMAYAILSESLVKSDSTKHSTLTGHLLLVKAALLCKDYQESWRILCKLIELTRSVKSDNLIVMVTVFQIYLLGCNTALHLHKIPLAEHLGYRCINTGNLIVASNVSQDLENWVLNTQELCISILFIINMGKRNYSRANKLVVGASSLFVSPAVLVMDCLVAVQENQLEYSLRQWLKGRGEEGQERRCSMSDTFLCEVDKFMTLIKNDCDYLHVSL